MLMLVYVLKTSSSTICYKKLRQNGMAVWSKYKITRCVIYVCNVQVFERIE
jgi:hypothetical protein